MHYMYIALIGSLLALDTTVAFQILISQPIFSCPIIGYICGDTLLGLQVGFFLQLVWLIRLPVGASVIPEGNTAAIVIAALVVGYNEGDHFYPLLIICFLYGLLISYFGGELVVLYRRTNTLILHKLLKLIGNGKMKYLGYVTFFSLIYHFVLMYMLLIAALFIGDFLLKYLVLLPASWEILFKYAVIGLLGIGVGLVLSLYKSSSPRIVLLVGIVIGNSVFLLMS
jgi:PTS system mannose-specific IIC component